MIFIKRLRFAGRSGRRCFARRYFFAVLAAALFALLRSLYYLCLSLFYVFSF